MKFVAHEAGPVKMEAGPVKMGAGPVKMVAVSAKYRIWFDAWRTRLLLEKRRRDL
jgi:hypothetical protein